MIVFAAGLDVLASVSLEDSGYCFLSVVVLLADVRIDARVRRPKLIS